MYIQNVSGTSETSVAYYLLITKMGYNKFIASLLRSKSAKALLKRRHNVPGIFYTSKCNASTLDRNNKNNKLDDDLDKPIKFSTSEAATWPASRSTTGDKDVPSCQSTVVTLSLIIFYIYFTQLREENDIDQKMVENIPIEIQEQIYGKKEKK